MKKAFLGILAVSILVVLVLVVVKVTGSTSETNGNTVTTTECSKEAPVKSCCDSNTKDDSTASVECEEQVADKGQVDCTEKAVSDTEETANKECSPAKCPGQ